MRRTTVGRRRAIEYRNAYLGEELRTVRKRNKALERELLQEREARERDRMAWASHTRWSNDALVGGNDTVRLYGMQTTPSIAFEDAGQIGLASVDGAGGAEDWKGIYESTLKCQAGAGWTRKELMLRLVHHWFSIQ